MDISVYGGDGGSIGLMTKSTENVAATGKVQATGGTGGTASAFGLDNREANSKLVAAADIKITAVGGKGGGSNYDGISKSDFTEAERGVIANEIATGTGGTAMAAGIQNTAGSLQATVQKLQISATGGMGNDYGSVYGSQGITGGTGGAAAAYGINILDGTASEVTAAEIAVHRLQAARVDMVLVQIIFIQLLMALAVQEERAVLDLQVRPMVSAMSAAQQL